MIKIYFDTLRHLTFRQIYNQIIHRVKKLISKKSPALISSPSNLPSLELIESIPARKSYLGNNEFFFLNQKFKFGNGIDWNYKEFGKLWGYNLNYFDFLHQEDMDLKESTKLLDSFCKEPHRIQEGAEPYPISLRGINWIKFFTFKKVRTDVYDSLTYSHYRHLSNNLEYHLLGNHLLENGCSLLFGAYYFGSRAFYKKAYRILERELKEQILSDGAHFELSPMYHQILLFRLLDCVNLVKNNSHGWIEESYLNDLLVNCSSKMIGWLEEVTFSNGDIPMVNDSAFDIAPTTSQLIHYAKRLQLKSHKTMLCDSGYRMIRTSSYELFIDIGNIGPDYIPGHAHSDTFNFLLYIENKPFLVDTGTSTYDRTDQRILERSTASHNTVKVDDLEQSEVWASFRVGRRAKIVRVEQKESTVSGIHDGYKFLGIEHQRSWHWSETQLVIIDEVVETNSETTCEAHFHFHPGVIDFDVYENGKVKVDSVYFHFADTKKCLIAEYEYCIGFNNLQKAKKLVVPFTKQLTTTIDVKSF